MNFPGAKGKQGAARRCWLEAGRNSCRRQLLSLQVPEPSRLEPQHRGGFQLTESRQSWSFAVPQSQPLLRAAMTFGWKCSRGISACRETPFSDSLGRAERRSGFKTPVTGNTSIAAEPLGWQSLTGNGTDTNTRGSLEMKKHELQEILILFIVFPSSLHGSDTGQYTQPGCILPFLSSSPGKRGWQHPVVCRCRELPFCSQLFPSKSKQTAEIWKLSYGDDFYIFFNKDNLIKKLLKCFCNVGSFCFNAVKTIMALKENYFILIMSKC